MYVRLLLLIAMVSSGCTPSVRVTPNPSPETRGLRYYRPKPFLHISPLVVTEGSDRRTSDRYVRIELEYLPDFSEEYAIEVRGGFGTNKTQLTIKDGWNLVRVSEDLDSKTAANTNAVANLIRAATGQALFNAPEDKTTPASPVPAQPPTQPPLPTPNVSNPPQFYVRATNVPLGYYEAVVGYAAGAKRHYGWRYVGFYPHSPCPLQMNGAEHVGCDQNAIWGLVFEDGVMTMRTIGEIAQQKGTEKVSLCELLPPVEKVTAPVGTPTPAQKQELPPQQPSATTPSVKS